MKLKEFQKEMSGKGIGCCVFANLRNKDENIFYFLQDEVEYCFLLIPSKGAPKLFVPSSERWTGNMKGIVVRKGFSQMAFLKRHLARCKKIGINKSSLSVNAYRQLRKIKKAEFVDVSKSIYALRETKTEEEIRKIEAACRITDRVMRECIRGFNEFRTEKGVEAFLSRQGYDLAFKPIVASGNNSALPHSRPGSRLKRGFCVIDFGIRLKGYCSDMTRTVCLKAPSKKERRVYGLLLDAQKQAIRSIRPGMRLEEMHTLIKEKLSKNHLRMVHAFGHSIGIEVHDPYSYEKNKRLLPNTVFTIEPGIYFRKKFGIRIEDVVLVTETGSRALTKFPKELLVIG